MAGEAGAGDGPRVQGVGLDPVTAPVPGSGHGEQHVRGLGLDVGQRRVVRAAAEVDVVEDDRGVQVGPGADRDHPGAPGGPQRGQQPQGEAEVKLVIRLITGSSAANAALTDATGGESRRTSGVPVNSS